MKAAISPSQSTRSPKYQVMLAWSNPCILWHRLWKVFRDPTTRANFEEDVSDFINGSHGNLEGSSKMLRIKLKLSFIISD